MNVLQLSWSDLRGGAARAAYRLHLALGGIGVQSRLLVNVKASKDMHVYGPESLVESFRARIAARWDGVPLRRYPRKKPTLFSPAFAPSPTVPRARRLARHITHLHWVANGFLPVAGVPHLEGPLVWSLHDAWPFTGGCHYTDGCDRYTNSCGRCPSLASSVENDLSRDVWSRKRAAWSQVDMTIIASSRWMASMARASSLFRDRRIELLPNCVDTEEFSVKDKSSARAALGLPHDRRLILFGALSSKGDRRKGQHLLSVALDRFARRAARNFADLVVMGEERPEGDSQFPLNAHYLGVITDDTRLAAAYAAADIIVAPSLEDNLPYLVMEAMSCGTPCVAFDCSGMRDLIEHKVTGYLATAYEPEDMARGIEEIVKNDEWRRFLSENARSSVVRKYSPKVIAEKHRSLYEDILVRKNEPTG